MREILRIWMSQADRHKNRTELQARLARYVGKLLAAYTHNLPDLPLPETRISSSIHQITPVNPLTERELEVLHLIAEGLSNLAIAQKLYFSPGTVKVHIKHIYGKLDVNSRTQAVPRLQELNLP